MQEKGIILLEFLLYIALVGVIVAAAGTIGYNIFFGKAKLGAIEEVSQNSRFAIEKISDTIRNAEEINNPLP